MTPTLGEVCYILAERRLKSEKSKLCGEWQKTTAEWSKLQTVRPGAFQDSFQPYLEGIRIAVIGILIFHGLPFFFCVEVSFQR